MTHPKRVTVSVSRAKFDLGHRWKTVLYGFNAAGRRALTDHLPGVRESADAAIRHGAAHARRKFPRAAVEVAAMANLFVAQEDLGPVQKDAPPVTVVVTLRPVRRKAGPDQYAAVTRRYSGRRALIGASEEALAHDDPRAALQTGLANAQMQFLSEPIVTSPVAERMIEIWQQAQVGAPS
jgi:hypothetical protein